MGRIEEYNRVLERATEEARTIIDRISDSETQLEDAIASTCEEIKRTYIEEAKRLIDRIAQEKLDEIEREESQIPRTLIKWGIGWLGSKLSEKAQENESALRFAHSAYKGYGMDELHRMMIRHASAMAKQKVEDQVLNMKRNEFASSLKGGEAMRESVNAIFQGELRTLHQIQEMYKPVFPRKQTSMEDRGT